MLRRKIESILAEWKKSEHKKPIVIKGIRQCGKTYIVQKFAKENYESVIYMNFILEPDKKSAFTGNIDVDTILLNLSALIPGSRFISGKTCIILDEIQECREARTALKSSGTKAPPNSPKKPFLSGNKLFNVLFSIFIPLLKILLQLNFYFLKFLLLE